jgi:ankyrin repeat protein
VITQQPNNQNRYQAQISTETAYTPWYKNPRYQVDYINTFGKTLFYRALSLDNVYEIKTMLKTGFSPNTYSWEKNDPPLVYALQQEAFKSALTLASHPDLDPELQNKVGENALMLAALKKQGDIVDLLLKKGAIVNKNGWGPLHYAATSGDTNIIKALLKAGAFINALAPNQNTPLMMAVLFGGEKAVKLLLSHGANPHLRNNAGRSAIDLAHNHHKDRIIKVLQ